MRLGPALALLALAVLALLEYASFAGTAVATTTFDSGLLLRCAERSPFELEFWQAVRPPTVPLLYQLVDRDPEHIRILQASLSVLCWFALGYALALEARRPWVRVAAFALPPSFALAIPINQWDGVLMTESVFLSLFAATSALTLRLARSLARPEGRTAPVFFAWALVWFAFAGSRDSAGYLLAIPLAFFAARLVRELVLQDGESHAGWLAAAVVVGGMALFASRASMQAGERWRTPLLNVLLQRIVPDPELGRMWRERYGLPDDSVLAAQAGRMAWSRVEGGRQLRKELASDPELADVEDWLARKGVRSYERFLLLDRPLEAWRAALAALEPAVNPGAPIAPGDNAKSGYGRGAGVKPWTRALTAFTYARIPAPAVVGGIALAAALALVIAGRSRGLAATSLALLLGAVTQAFVTWHGDAAEVDRHMLIVGVLFRLGLAVLVLAGSSFVQSRSEDGGFDNA